MSPVERELKLGVWPEFALPDLGRALRRGSMGEVREQRLEATYYDTRDLRLLRRGVTLRHRAGEAGGAVWTLKLPGETASIGLVRREVTLHAKPGVVPQQLADLARGWALGARLQPVAQMLTTRRSVPVLDRDGTAVASVDDDEVVVLRGRKVAARFRELEVELAPDAPAAVLERLARPLRSAGAQPVPQLPKLAHALGPEATEPWDLAVPQLSSRPSVREVTARRLTALVGQIVDAHAALVLDESRDAARASRAAVRLVRVEPTALCEVADTEELARLDVELAWFERLLAGLDGLAGVTELAAAEGAFEAGCAPLLAAVVAQRAATQDTIVRALRGTRHRRLLVDLVAMARADATADGDGDRRWSSGHARRTTRQRLADARRALEPGGDAPFVPVTAELAAARLWVAADASASVAGPAARAAADAVGDLVGALAADREAGELVAILEALGGRVADPRGVFAAGRLAGRAEGAAPERRAAVDAAAREALRKSRWTWVG